MNTLPEALALIATGWSPRQSIVDRAVAMLGHAEAGNDRRAEEYAAEIEALQRAYEARQGTGPRAMPVWAVSVWQIGHKAWANLLMHGWRCGREVFAAEGWTVGNVAGRLCFLHPGHVITGADVIAPRVLVGRAAA